MSKDFKKLWPVLLGALILYLIGMSWGLPSTERAERVLAPEQRTDAFYKTLEDNRRAMYQRIGLNITATYGRGQWNGELLPSTTAFRQIRYLAGKAPNETLMHGYSSFILRSVEQDEQFTLNALSRMKPKHLDFNSHQTANGGAFLYPVAAVMATLHIVGYTHLTTDPLFYYRNPDELARLFKAGRLFSVLCGLGCVVMVFLIGRLLYDERVGLWSAALFGLSPTVVAYTHIMKPHVPAAFLSLWCLFYCLKGAKEKRPREFFAANLLFGLAVSAAKYCWILAAPMWLCWWLSNGKKLSVRQFLTLAGWNALAVAVYGATNIFALLDWRDLLAEMHAEGAWYHSTLNPAAIFHLLGRPMRLGLSDGAWLVGICGLLGALYKRGPSERLLLIVFLPLIACLSFLVSSAAGEPATIRFCMGPAAILVLLSVGWISKQSPLKDTPWLNLVLAVALIVTVGKSALFDANFLRDSMNESNAFAAARWIEARAPKFGELGFATPAPMLDRFPPVRFLNYDLVYLNDGPVSPADEKKLPQYFITSGRQLEDLPQNAQRYYEVLQKFNAMGSFADPFTSANYPLLLLSKKAR